MTNQRRGIENRESGIPKSGLSKSDELVISKQKLESSNWTLGTLSLPVFAKTVQPVPTVSLRHPESVTKNVLPMSPNAHIVWNPGRVKVPRVQFEISDFGFEMTSLSDFTTSDF